MYLLLLSIPLGILGYYLGINTHTEAISIFFGIMGFLSPSVVMIGKLYKKIDALNSKTEQTQES